jgi:hydrogenase nickel incorporation protein HypA/HybF
MGITQGILASAFDAARDSGATTITEIRITIGELTEIQEFALQFAFEALTPGTMAEGAVLTVTHLEPRSHCNTCGIDYTHDRFEMLCPECSSFDVTPIQGREMRIDSIECDAPGEADAVSAESSEE